MAKIKIIKATIVNIEKGLLITDKGHSVFTSIAKNNTNKIGDNVEYVLYQGVVTKRFQSGRSQWLDEVKGGNLFYKQI